MSMISMCMASRRLTNLHERCDIITRRRRPIVIGHYSDVLHLQYAFEFLMKSSMAVMVCLALLFRPLLSLATGRRTLPSHSHINNTTAAVAIRDSKELRKRRKKGTVTKQVFFLKNRVALSQWTKKE